ncbi:MAG: ATP-binding cassette domain-containing protein, partial [Bifidobacteriaceae bacterium]|nr:ATP-binding cassette domain-containing protein [Bifidobacteriaceae bacterium]
MNALVLRQLCVAYGSGRLARTVVKDVNLTIPTRTVVGLVGESGSGKSTVARAIVGLVKPASGTIALGGAD